jgi:hypothetical protein
MNRFLLLMLLIATTCTTNLSEESYQVKIMRPSRVGRTANVRMVVHNRRQIEIIGKGVNKTL